MTSLQVPTAIKDFVFDLYSSSRQSLRQDEVAKAYEVEYKALTEHFSSWPEDHLVATDFNNDAIFKLFYR